MDWRSRNPQSAWPACAASGTQISIRPVLQRKSPNSIRGVAITTRRRYTVAMTSRPQLRQTLITINAEVIRLLHRFTQSELATATQNEMRMQFVPVKPFDFLRVSATLTEISAANTLSCHEVMTTEMNMSKQMGMSIEMGMPKRDEHVESWWRHPSHAFKTPCDTFLVHK